jgi:hypothetical protein
MALLEKLREVARLAGIVGVAAAGLALSYCSSSTPPAQDVRQQEGSAGHDAAVPSPDAGAPDAAAKQDQATPKPDQRLWDVICE